ncbi:HYDIN protein, partial [Ptilonorhynchus violaceus]|nr:HYDIN protein [Ptilonorhynchus violaceus]
QDYCHSVDFISGRETITVPIRAVCARAILEFPDELDFACPVKCSSEKTVLLRNRGNGEARYHFNAESPFSVVPATGTLGAGETMQVTVIFHPMRSDEYFTRLEVRCDTGKSIYTKLHGKAKDFNIALNTYTVNLKAFLTKSDHATVVIENRSNITARFQWKTFANEEEENRMKMRLFNAQCPRNEERVDRLVKASKMETGREEYLSILPRMEQELRTKVQQNPLLFSDDIFSIEPLEGEIGPNCSAEIKLTFKPQKALVYEKVAYCNISGREGRLPLRLIGEGQGPWLELSYYELNLAHIFINSPHIYEVKLFNKGPIDAPFSLTPPSTDVGSCFKFEPQEGIIAPGGCQAIKIFFKCDIVGCFVE